MDLIEVQPKGGVSMKKIGRKFSTRLISALGAVCLIMTSFDLALGCLAGTWKVRCPKGHDDIVEQITCNHICEKCGAKAFTDGNGYIVCPDGHANHVKTGNRNQRDKWLLSYKCEKCGKECCLKSLK